MGIEEDTGNVMTIESMIKRRKRLLFWYRHIRDNISNPRVDTVLCEIQRKRTELKFDINTTYGVSTSNSKNYSNLTLSSYHYHH